MIGYGRTARGCATAPKPGMKAVPRGEEVIPPGNRCGARDGRLPPFAAVFLLGALSDLRGSGGEVDFDDRVVQRDGWTRGQADV